MRPAIQKLFGSFKGDAFDKRVLPFFHACNDFQAGQGLKTIQPGQPAQYITPQAKP